MSKDPLILIFAFKRFEFINEIISACFRDAPEKHVRLIVDGAEKKELSQIQKNQIANLLNSFPELEVVLRPVNFGLRRNILSGITEAFLEYESVIVLEDDCIPEDGFFDFILTQLKVCQADKKVRSVCGFVPGQVDLSCRNIESERSSQRFIPWGWATWADRWLDYENDSGYLLSQCKSKNVNLPKDLDAALLRISSTNTEQNIWSVNWSAAHFLYGNLAIYPRRGLIQNRGFDGSGVHTGVTNTFESISSMKKKYDFVETTVSEDFSATLGEFMERNWQETLIPVEDRLDL